MLSERPWQPDLVLRFLSLVLMSFAAGLFLVSLLVSDAAARFLNPDYKQYVLLIGGTLSFHGMVLALIPNLLKEHGLNLKSAFGISISRSWKPAILSVGVGIIVIPVVLLLGQVSSDLLQWQGIDIKFQTPVEMLRKDASLTLRTLIFLVAVIVAPVAEEVLFRGILYPSFKRLGFPRAALWGTSLVFGIIHVNLLSLLPLTVLALILTLLYEATDDLAGPIIMHSFFNLVNFISLSLSAQP